MGQLSHPVREAGHERPAHGCLICACLTTKESFLKIYFLNYNIIQTHYFIPINIPLLCSVKGLGVILHHILSMPPTPNFFFGETCGFFVCVSLIPLHYSLWRMSLSSYLSLFSCLDYCNFYLAGICWHTQHLSVMFRMLLLIWPSMCIRQIRSPPCFPHFTECLSPTVSRTNWTVFTVNVYITVLLITFASSLPSRLHPPLHSVVDTLNFIFPTLHSALLARSLHLCRSLCLEHSPLAALPGWLFKWF